MERRLPSWLHRPFVDGDEVQKTRFVFRELGLATICENARCPNIGDCYRERNATFLILGNVCTRGCQFCAVRRGRPAPVDADEPANVARAARRLNLRYVVLTSVTRDDVSDGGAGHFARTISQLKQELPGVKVEALTPDFGGSSSAIAKVINAGVDVFAHNLETVPRLYERVRPGADYRRSLEVLKRASALLKRGFTKSGLMLGLGEREEEVMEVWEDLREVGCRILTLGQYLRPRKDKLPVSEYIRPEKFFEYEEKARARGFGYVASGPWVRSSYRAEEVFKCMNQNA